MFDENFTFDASRSPSLDSSNAPSTRDTSRSVSPCSTMGPFPLPTYSVTDLAAHFADQRLRTGSQICYDSCEAYANNDDEASWSVEPSIEDADTAIAPVSRSRRSVQRPARPHSPSQRLQRQVNARLLCTSSHHRDIAALVSRMVESKQQCSVSPPQAIAPTAEAAQEDEGYDSSDGSTAVQSRRSSVAVNGKRVDHRRSSDMRASGACVSKSVRFRRDRVHSRVRSSDKA